MTHVGLRREKWRQHTFHNGVSFLAHGVGPMCMGRTVCKRTSAFGANERSDKKFMNVSEKLRPLHTL